MFGERLKALRSERGLIQKDIAEYLNVSQSTVGMYERGYRDPDTETLQKLAKFFDVSTDYLLGLSNIKKYETTRTAFHTTSVDGLDESDIMLVENLIKGLKEKHKK